MGFMHETNSLFGYFFQDSRRFSKCSSAFVSSAAGAAAAAAMKATWPGHGMKILASCDQGILCCRHCSNSRYYACKPATSQWQPLPNPNLLYDTEVVTAIAVLHSTPLRYIIVRLYWSHRMQYECEIFDSEIWAWETIECPIPYGEFIYDRQTAVAVGGRSVHWLTINDNVVALDIMERRFRCFPLPEVVRWNRAYVYKQLTEYEGGLGLICLVEDEDWSEMELWTAQGRMMVVDMKAVGESLPYPFPIEFCSSDVVLMMTADGVVLVNLRSGSFSRVEVPYHLRNRRQVFRFRSDFERVDLRGGR